MTDRVRTKKILAGVVFLVLLGAFFYGIDRFVTPKYMYDQKEPQTETFRTFYGMEKDSVDILILGTSHAATGFNPQDFYDAANLRVFNLASSGQAVWASYYWLNEALNYQSPKVVIYDVNYLFSNKYNEALNRKTLDNMRLGAVKLEAARAASASDETGEETVISYILPFFRYHARWSSLNEWDFTGADVESPSALKGFWIYPNTARYEEMVPLDPADSDETAEFDPDSFSWFVKIQELCEENGIRLVLTKTPAHQFTLEQHNAMQQYADENGMAFYDFNTASLYAETGFDYASDMNDAGETNAHANPSGARKMSAYLAEQIVANGWAPACEDAQWASTKQLNDNLYRDFVLHNTDDLHVYLPLLKDARYTVFLSVKDEVSACLDDEALALLRDLGLAADLEGAFQYGYLAVIDQGRVTYEKKARKQIEYDGALRDGVVPFSMSSAGYKTGNISSISINNAEQSLNRRGLNIVVYSNERQCVIDRVSFDTHVPEMTCSR